MDLLKSKPLLLEITADLTEGIVNGKKLKVRSLVKPLQKETQDKQMATTPGLQDEDAQMPNPDHQNPIREQLRALKSRNGWPHFKDVFMMCATDGEDVQTLKVERILMTWII